MDNNISVDITPDKSLIQKLGLVGYRTVQAIAELLDNSIDARIDDKEERIIVKLDFEKKRIIVRDDGYGMDKHNLKDALTIAKGTKSDERLGQFGIGLKSACSALGKGFVIRTSQINSNKEYLVAYDEDKWLSDKSLNWKNFKISEKILTSQEDWHGTIIVIDNLKVPLYPTQVTKFKENFGLRYALYLQQKQVSIQVNTGFCKPHHVDMEEGSKTMLDLQLSSGITIKGYVALLKKHSIRGYYGINLIKHGRLIKSFAKFGFPPHPENAKIIGELNLDHVPVNFYKSEFIEESKEYQEVLKAFSLSNVLKAVRTLAKSKSSAIASLESVFDYFDGKSNPQHLQRSVRQNLTQKLLNHTKPFEIKMGKNTVQIAIKSLKNEPLYTVKTVGSKKIITINSDEHSFKFVRNPLFLIGVIASEVKLLSRNPDFEKFIQVRNREFNEFLKNWFEDDKKEIFRDREIPIPDILNYNLADEPIDLHDFLKENSESKFQFTALSTLVPYLHNLRGKIVYTIHTTPNKGEYVAQLLSEKFGDRFTIVDRPDLNSLTTLLKMPKVDRIVAIREYSVIKGSTIATPNKAFVDLLVETHTHDIPLDDADLKRILQTMERHGLINLNEIQRYAKLAKKSSQLEKITGDDQVMVDLHFQSYLNEKSIEKIRQAHGFRDPLSLEKFIMDFEVLTHIRQVLPDCVVKGGMATPFHLNDKRLRRLSVDIDLVTARSRDQVIQAMKTVSIKLAGVVNIGSFHVPRHKNNKELPLLTYYCDYQSSIDDNSEIKIEIFYGNDMKIQSKKIDSDFEIIGIPINFPLSIYDHGSLIGDKLTTLPFNTIGIGSDREIDVPKQIYDIATLLKSLPNQVPMKMIIDTFEKISETQISYFKGTKFTIEDVLKDLANFSETLLITKNQIKLNPSYQGRFEKFTTELLGNMRYPAHAHVTDILLIKIIIKLILKKFNGAELETITEKATQVLVGLNTISNMDTNSKNIESKKIRAKYGQSSNVGKIMRDLFPEQVYLYDQLIEIDLIPTA